MARLPSSSTVSQPLTESRPCVLGLFVLPNEILMQILSLFHTQQLLGLTTVCQHFRDQVIRIFQSRLILAETLEDRRLILECYHPSAQSTEQYLSCDYLGTPGLNDGLGGQRTPYDIGDVNGCFGQPGRLYSRFKLTSVDNLARPQLDGNFQTDLDVVTPDMHEGEAVRRTVSLDSYELFSQLCISVAIVQIGPRRGVFLNFMDVLKRTTVRVWRQWLAEKSVNLRDPLKHSKHERLIWVDQDRHVGLRVQVQERKSTSDASIPQHKDEDRAVSYHLELEELIVRSTYLLASLERSLFEINSKFGKAIIFGSFAP